MVTLDLHNSFHIADTINNQSKRLSQATVKSKKTEHIVMRFVRTLYYPKTSLLQSRALQSQKELHLSLSAISTQLKEKHLATVNQPIHEAFTRIIDSLYSLHSDFNDLSIGTGSRKIRLSLIHMIENNLQLAHSIERTLRKQLNKDTGNKTISDETRAILKSTNKNILRSLDGNTSKERISC
ncbi:hypothetical protein [Deminuibacter soli]|uniref:Uncharacterized protein n=1 Tax=Deminuibacter soli TaxID=2291815 RepID=A0A3E1NE57_9BACT|nr:hypothetical protein [Deminuibacter soli]RFM26253.1 hypothetical protein DXN05_20290 [Deminuibacter soli]